MSPAIDTENVVVVCRCRPLNERERVGAFESCLEISEARGTINVKHPNNAADSKQFTFDRVFDASATQGAVFDLACRPVVDAVLGGFNGTIFCYGQTGTGKTFTMQGTSSSPEQRGIIPRTFHHIMSHVAQDKNKKFLVTVSYLEIYNEAVKDLLVKPSENPPGGLDVKEHPENGVYIKGLSSEVVNSVASLERLMETGNRHRSVGATLMNESSSRSHSIFTVTIDSLGRHADGSDLLMSGKLHLVDLAGSERQSKTGAVGDRLKEATKINLSLSALGNCINALLDVKRGGHIPYRDSKLTRLLQDSLGGNSKTLMIATLSPAVFNMDETLSTLRYASRAKNIKNRPKVNEDPKDTMLKAYQEEIEKLKALLDARQRGVALEAPVKKVVKKVVQRKTKLADLRPETLPKPDFQENVIASKSNERCHEAMDEPAIAPAELDLSPDLVQEVENDLASELNTLNMLGKTHSDERASLEARLKSHLYDLDSEKLAQDELVANLRSLEAKFINGESHLEDLVQKQGLQLEATKSELADEEIRARNLQLILESKTEIQVQLEREYLSLQEELSAKTGLLKKLIFLLAKSKAHLLELEDALRAERTDLLATAQELSKAIALKRLIVENFIPRREIDKLEALAVFTEQENEWQFKRIDLQTPFPLLKRPIGVSQQLKRPLCQYAKDLLRQGQTHARYNYENILSLPLEPTASTTVDASR